MREVLARDPNFDTLRFLKAVKLDAPVVVGPRSPPVCLYMYIASRRGYVYMYIAYIYIYICIYPLAYIYIYIYMYISPA